MVLAAWTGVSRPYLHYGDGGRLQNASPPSVLFESSQFLLQYTEDTDTKMMDQNFEIRKRRRVVPLRPIWTIMVAAKLDHSRVLVTQVSSKSVNVEG